MTMLTPKIRTILYAVGLLATGTLTMLSVFRIIEPGAASTISAQIAAFLGIFGVGATGTAAVITNRQRKDGTFDQPDPADVVVNSIEAVLAAQQHAQANVERVKDAVTKAVKDVPILGPLAKQAIDALP